MRALKQLFDKRAWAADMTRQVADFFRRLSTQQGDVECVVATPKPRSYSGGKER